MRSDSGLILGCLRDPRNGIAGADRASQRTLRSVGLWCIFVGSIAQLAIGLLADETMVVAAVSAGWTLAWAFVRLLVLSLTAPAALQADRTLLGAVWGTGLLPFAVGLTGLTVLVAFLASSWLTYQGIRGAGASTRDAGVMTGAAFGGQAAVEVASWFGRAGTFILLA